MDSRQLFYDVRDVAFGSVGLLKIKDKYSEITLPQ